jgi:hypothetical protein
VILALFPPSRENGQLFLNTFLLVDFFTIEVFIFEIAVSMTPLKPFQQCHCHR